MLEFTSLFLVAMIVLKGGSVGKWNTKNERKVGRTTLTCKNEFDFKKKCVLKPKNGI